MYGYDMTVGIHIHAEVFEVGAVSYTHNKTTYTHVRLLGLKGDK